MPTKIQTGGASKTCYTGVKNMLYRGQKHAIQGSKKEREKKNLDNAPNLASCDRVLMQQKTKPTPYFLSFETRSLLGNPEFW